MGADIYGWVEVREPNSEWWYAAIRISHIVDRYYGMFASLFGVRNGGQESTEDGRFRAIASGRGAPPGASEYYRREWDEHEGGVGETWVLWSELTAFDWEEEGSKYVDEQGYVYAEPWPGRRRERRGDHLDGGWATLFRMMQALAVQFGEENVRLAVWFDQW